MESVDDWRFCSNCGYALQLIQPRQGALWEKRCDGCAGHYYAHLDNPTRVTYVDWRGVSGDLVNVRVHLHDGSLACEAAPESGQYN